MESQRSFIRYSFVVTMQVRDVNFKSKELDTYKTLAPLAWFLKIFAINCDITSENTLKSSWSFIRSIITATILGTMNCYSLYMKIYYLYDDVNISIRLTDVVQTIYDHFQYIVDLYFVYKYGRRIGFEYFKQYKSIDKILDMSYCSLIKRRLIKLIVFFVSIWLISSICDLVAWYLSYYKWTGPLVYSVAYIYFFIKILTTLDLTSHVMLIEIRLRHIGDLVQDYYTHAEPLPGLIDNTLSNENWLYSKACHRTLELKTRSPPLKKFDNNTEVKWLSSSYLMLSEQVAFINKIFGFRILLNSLSLLIDMVRFTNLAVRIVIGSQNTPIYSGYTPAVSTVMRLITCIAVIISLVNHCEQVYRQRDRLLSIIDHILINKNPTAELRIAMVELQGLVQSRQIHFDMAHFIQLNYSLLVSIASVVFTYTIIILQSVK